MRWVALTVTAALVFSGCASAEGNRMVGYPSVVVGDAGILVGSMMLLAHAIGPSDSCESDCNDPSPVTGGVLLGTGLALVITGGVLIAVSRSQDRHERQRKDAEAEQKRAQQESIEQQQIAHEQREREHAEQEKTQRRDRAFALLKSAVEAARTDRCVTALELGPQIRELDPEIHEAWFVGNPDIKRCLAPAPSSEPQPAPNN